MKARPLRARYSRRKIFEKLEKALDSWYRDPIIRESFAVLRRKGERIMTSATKSRRAAEVVVRDVPET
jgi:hypothetical protein